MATKNARRNVSQNTETVETTTPVEVAETPAAPSLEVTVIFDMSQFNAEVAEINRELAAKIKSFREEHSDKLSAEQKANLAGLARGYTRIANDLSKTDN